MNADKFSKLDELTEHFAYNLSQYKSSSYDEANTRVDFIDNFFELLDWDVRNNQKYSENYREVIREDKVVIEGKPKAPDYSFRIGGIRKFFVEAKKPSVNIREAVESAFQVRRYGYTAKLPLSILTNFEEFSVYDTRIKPDKSDKAGIARIFTCSFKEYKDKFDFIYNTFSKEAILKGSFDKYIEENKNKKGTSEVDQELLKVIEEWRKELARIIALRNSDIDVFDLNNAVQKIIDRIIFLRIAEDRRIEDYESLRNAAKFNKTNSIYKNLNELFVQADKKFNAGLFRREQWLEDITIDDKILSTIINSLYYPDCPYEFSILPIEILGNIYEQFLGKTIKIRGVKGGHTAQIEEKPEVRKAGGVYYTPQYIVDYIVQNTVGEKIKDAVPDDVSNLKILDPACGSGSFLVGAYNFLLNYHLDYYINHNRNQALKQGLIYLDLGNVYRLSIKEKQRILVNNIYGVDIDVQAVEVTKLSLYLKLLENESIEQGNRIFKYSDMKLLPSLENNIKSGNSLIGSDFYSDKDLTLFGKEDLRKVNAFDWEKEFPLVFGSRSGDSNLGFGDSISSNPESTIPIPEKKGFDIVIGNPPYIKEYTNTEQFHLLRDSKRKNYYEGKMDLWYAFSCLSIDLLKENGLHSYIATNNWTTATGASILRNKISSETKFIKYIDFSDYKIFQNANIQTMIYLVCKKEEKNFYQMNYTKITNSKIKENELIEFIRNNTNVNNNIVCFDLTLSPIEMYNKTFTFIEKDKNNILFKILNKQNYFLNNKEIAQGIVAPQDSIIDSHLKHLKENNNYKKKDGIFVLNNNELKYLNLDSEELQIIKPYFTTENLFKYYGIKKNIYWIIYSDINVRMSINNYPKIKKHLDNFKSIITSDFAPYGLHRARNNYFFEGEKIISLRKTKFPKFTYVDFACYVSQSYYILKPSNINLKYLTGLLNSKLIVFWLKNKGKMQGDIFQIDKEPLLNIPIFNPTDKQYHDKLVNLVEQMLTTQKEYHAEGISLGDKQYCEQKIQLLDRQIDAIVYKLYDLTDAEIKIVEGN